MPNRHSWITPELQEQIYLLRRNAGHSVRIDVQTAAGFEEAPDTSIELLSELVQFLVATRRFSQFAGRLHYIVGDDFVGLQRNTFNRLRFSFEDHRSHNLSITIAAGGVSRLQLPGEIELVTEPSSSRPVDDHDPNHPVVNVTDRAEISDRPTHLIPCPEEWSTGRTRPRRSPIDGSRTMGATRFQRQLIEHPDRAWTVDLFQDGNDPADDSRPFGESFHRGPSPWGTEWVAVSNTPHSSNSQRSSRTDMSYLWRSVSDAISSLMDRLVGELGMRTRRGTNQHLLWRRIMSGLRWRISPDWLLVTYAPQHAIAPGDIEPRALTTTTTTMPQWRSTENFLSLNIAASPFLRLPAGVRVPPVYVVDDPFSLPDDFPVRSTALWTLPGTHIADHRPADIQSLLDAGTRIYTDYFGSPDQQRRPRRIQERTFGVELEIIGLSTRGAAEALLRQGITAEAESYNHQTRSHWKCVPDASLLPSRGTPIPASDDPDDDEIAAGTQREESGEFNPTPGPMCGGCIDPDCEECGGAGYNEDCGACRDGECDGHPTVGDERHSFPHAEIVSPVLNYNNPHQWRELHTVIDALHEGGAQVTRRCGFHVHVGANDLSRQQIAALVEAYQTMGWLFDQLCDRSRRGQTNYNCRHLSPRQLHSLTQAIREGHFPDQYRYSSINVACFPRQGTVEFRQHQGTLDGIKIANWIRLCVGMVQAAVEDQLPSMRSDMSETTMLDALSTMVDGPTALWFLQRRGELNAESNLAHPAPPPADEAEEEGPGPEPEYPNEEGISISGDGDSEFQEIDPESLEGQSPSPGETTWHDPVRGEGLRVSADDLDAGELVQSAPGMDSSIRYSRYSYPSIRMTSRHPQYLYETETSSTANRIDEFSWNLDLSIDDATEPNDEPQE